jgi:small subunit ribosomal protein S6
MRTYEIIFILKPEIPEEEGDRLIAQMELIVTSTGGTIRKIEKMGQRRLAYLVGRYREGHYVLFVVDCEAATIKEFERRLRVSDAVIKFQSVRVDEETKRLEKLRGIRAKKLARKKPKPPRPGAEPAAAATA